MSDTHVESGKSEVAAPNIAGQIEMRAIKREIELIPLEKRITLASQYADRAERNLRALAVVTALMIAIKLYNAAPETLVVWGLTIGTRQISAFTGALGMAIVYYAVQHWIAKTAGRRLYDERRLLSKAWPLDGTALDAGPSMAIVGFISYSLLLWFAVAVAAILAVPDIIALISGIFERSGLAELFSHVNAGGAAPFVISPPSE